MGDREEGDMGEEVGGEEAEVAKGGSKCKYVCHWWKSISIHVLRL